MDVIIGEGVLEELPDKAFEKLGEIIRCPIVYETDDHVFVDGKCVGCPATNEASLLIKEEVK